MEQTAAEQGGMVSVPTKEIVSLAAVDSILFCRTFLPKTFRQESPPMHREIFSDLWNPEARHVALEVFRDGAKTTLLRAFTLQRICYAVSRTVLFVSAAQGHSERSIRWIKRQIEHNRLLTETYGLSKGTKWTDDWIEIRHNVEGVVINIIGLGITGQTRGINIEDYRPDLIVVDDPCDEENTGTPDQRAKTAARFFGAIEKSLTPASENKNAKMVLLQTSLHKEDLINTLHKDPSWHTKKFGVFDKEGDSRWPQRYPTPVLQAEKKAHIDRNQLSLWLREKECILSDPETSDFKSEWLRFWDIPPERPMCVLSIDPTPPPSEAQIATEFRNKDFEAIGVQGLYKGNYYLLEYHQSRGHQPEWLITKFFEMRQRWKPVMAVVEGVAYQRTLKWILEKEMRERKQYTQIKAETDKAAKRHRILQAFSGIASARRYFINKDMVEFYEQFTTCPNSAHDDLLDMCAIGLKELERLDLDSMDSEEVEENEFDNFKRKRANFRGAP